MKLSNKHREELRGVYDTVLDPIYLKLLVVEKERNRLLLLLDLAERSFLKEYDLKRIEEIL